MSDQTRTPGTGRPRPVRPGTRPAAGVPASGVADDQGRPWVRGLTSGDVVWFGDGHRRDRAAAVPEPGGRS